MPLKYRVILTLGLLLLVWTGVQLVGIVGKQVELAGDGLGTGTSLATADAPAFTYDAVWDFNAETGFAGNVILRAVDAPDAVPATFPIAYPAAFAGGLSIHRVDQKQVPSDLHDSRLQSGIAYLGCLDMATSLTLTATYELQTVARDYRICRVTARGAAVPAVIGYIHPTRNRQPLDQPVTRCAAEAAIWLDRVAAQDTHHAICMVVIDENAGLADVIVFERGAQGLIVRASKTAPTGTVVPTKKFRVRNSQNLERFKYFQAWMQDTETVAPEFYSMLPALGERIAAQGLGEDLRGLMEVEDVIVLDAFIRIKLRSLSDKRLEIRNGEMGRFRGAVHDLLCNDPATAALLDLQALDTVVVLRVSRQDGNPWVDGRHDETPCRAWRE